MITRLQLGAEVDIATKDELDHGIDSVLDELKGKRVPKPIYSTFAGSAISGVGSFVVELGRPPIGRVWNVLGITLAGSDDSTTVANAKAALYFGDPANGILSALKIPAMPVPYSQFISKGTLWCHSTEVAYVNISGAAGGLQVVAVLHIAEWREKDVAEHTGR